MTMAVGLAAAPAFADREGEGDRGRSAAAHEDAPGQAKRDEAGQENPGNGNGTPPAHAGGPGAQTSPPGHAKSQSEPAKPQHSSKPAKRPAAKPAEPAHPARPARPGHTPAAKPANPHAKAGKTTICHATGSATNPFVTITISDNALPAHARHHDGHDIIPAPAGGCPQDAAAGGAAAQAHRGAPEAGRAGVPAKGSAPAAGAVLPFIGGSKGETPSGAVLGVVAEGGQALPQIRESIAEARAAKVQRREAGSRTVANSGAEQLPFTGLEAALVALFGALLMLVGLLMRHLTRVPAAIA